MLLSVIISLLIWKYLLSLKKSMELNISSTTNTDKELLDELIKNESCPRQSLSRFANPRHLLNPSIKIVGVGGAGSYIIKKLYENPHNVIEYTILDRINFGLKQLNYWDNCADNLIFSSSFKNGIL